MSTDTEMSARAAEEIRALLGRRGINKSELARRLNVSHTWVTNRLTGSQEIGVNELGKIAVILGVDVADLLPKEDVTGGRPSTRQYLPGERVIATVGAKANTTTATIPQQRTRQHRQPSAVGSIRPLTAVGR